MVVGVFGALPGLHDGAEEVLAGGVDRDVSAQADRLEVGLAADRDEAQGAGDGRGLAGEQGGGN